MNLINMYTLFCVYIISDTPLLHCFCGFTIFSTAGTAIISLCVNENVIICATFLSRRRKKFSSLPFGIKLEEIIMMLLKILDVMTTAKSNT